MKETKRIKNFIFALVNTLDFTSFDGIIMYPLRLWLFYQVWFYTMINVFRLKNLFRLTRNINKNHLEGGIVECGVYKGGSAAVMAYTPRILSASKRGIWLFDSYEGLPKPTKKDGEIARKTYYKGFCKGTVSDVKRIFRKLKMDDEYLHIVKGWFNETFPKIKISKIALLHIDADWFDSVRLCLNKFYDSVLEGGYIVLDDYGCWEGCRKATDEFIKQRKLPVKLISVDGIGYYFQKPVSVSSSN